jgi:hypothetical protein
MKKIIRKISAFAIALLILFTGNFAYAVIHNDCINENDLHYTCESECCSEEQCSDGNGTKQIVKQENENGCCEIHDAKVLHHEYTPVLSYSVEKVKFIAIGANIISLLGEPTLNFASVFYNLSSTDILIHISTLRI